MRNIVIQYILEHSTFTLFQLQNFSDEKLLRKYNETRGLIVDNRQKDAIINT